MSNKWIPDWATHYRIERMNPADDGAFYVVLYNTHIDPSDPKPLGDHHQALIDDICSQIREKPLSERITPQSKYHKEIKPGVIVDWYDVAAAFSPKPSKMWEKVCGAVHHAHKKLCQLGSGDKELRQDLVEARDSLDRAIQQLDEWA